jgi:hypothetical protein
MCVLANGNINILTMVVVEVVVVQVVVVQVVVVEVVVVVITVHNRVSSVSNVVQVQWPVDSVDLRLSYMQNLSK